MAFFNLTHTGVQDPFKTASYGKEDESSEMCFSKQHSRLNILATIAEHTESSTEVHVEQERDTDSKDQSLEVNSKI